MPARPVMGVQATRRCRTGLRGQVFRSRLRPVERPNRRPFPPEWRRRDEPRRTLRTGSEANPCLRPRRRRQVRRHRKAECPAGARLSAASKRSCQGGWGPPPPENDQRRAGIGVVSDRMHQHPFAAGRWRQDRRFGRSGAAQLRRPARNRSGTSQPALRMAGRAVPHRAASRSTRRSACRPAGPLR